MKIEKISDNQIRFTLTGEDLAARQIKLSELAYGTEKARNLFREMMQQAASQVGFEADNIPLMIEAIPMSEGSIVLVVTKVENPEELDTRFSGFAPSLTASEGISGSLPGSFEQLLHSITASRSEGNENTVQAVPSSPASSAEVKDALEKFRIYAACNRLYSFDSMDSLLKAAARIRGAYTGERILQYSKKVWLLSSEEYKMKDIEEVRKMQPILAAVSEYSVLLPVTYAREQYLEEHGHILIPSGAIAQLARFSD